jgi:hypothetical protein
MSRKDAERIIEKSNMWTTAIMNLVAKMVESDEDDDGVRVGLFAMSKACAIHIQAMSFSAELSEDQKQELAHTFILSFWAALKDLDLVDQSEEVINKMMGKP